MANKFILFPEENYKALIAEKQKPSQQGGAAIGDDFQELSGLKFVKKKLGQVKKIKKKNVSAKNVLYNQRLRAYLKLRKQIKNKPLTINLSRQGPKMVSKGEQTAFVNNEGDAIPATKPEYGFPEKPVPAVETGLFTPASKVISPKIPTVIKPSTSQKEETPKSNRFLKKLEKEEAKKQVIENKATILKELILNNPTKFNITAGGDILNPGTGKTVANSDLDSTIDRLVNPTLANAPSPPGTRFLKKVITEDIEAHKLIYPYQEGRGKWQKGKAKKNKKFKSYKQMNRKIIKFKPTNWMKTSKRK